MATRGEAQPIDEFHVRLRTAIDRPPRPRGRPALPAGQATLRDKPLYCYTPPELRAQVEAAADADGTSVSAWLVDAAVSKLARKRPQEPLRRADAPTPAAMR